jgi:hypothetical protein
VDRLEHLGAAERATKAAEHLRNESPWAAVAAHYGAMHALHADLATRDDVPASERHPSAHRSHGYGDWRVLGTNDVIRLHYPPNVSQAYLSLASASVAVRYQANVPRALVDRLWRDLDVIVSHLNQA